MHRTISHARWNPGISFPRQDWSMLKSELGRRAGYWFSSLAMGGGSGAGAGAGEEIDEMSSSSSRSASACSRAVNRFGISEAENISFESCGKMAGERADDNET